MNDTPQPEGEAPPIKIPVIEEYIKYDTQRRPTGTVRIAKQVQEEIIEVDETVTHEEVKIDRIPINQYVDSAPPVRHEGEVMVVSVTAEVMVKRLLLVEELHIRKTIKTDIDTREVTLRKETVQIHRSQEES